MKEIIELIYEMSPYLLLGFLLAGLMHAFIPNDLYQRYLGGRSFRSVIHAALLGIPLPLCSCGVIPTAMSLYRQGASKGACVSFLIATPQTGVDSIIATYSLMGLPFALIRPLAALVTSLLGGQLVNSFAPDNGGNHTSTEGKVNPTHRTFMQKMGAALHYAFIEMMQDIGRWLLMGLVIAGLITAFVPDSFFALFADNTMLSILLVLLCAIPMYLCATGSIPIAVALMLKGLSPGTALVLLMAGPAVNVASILVIQKVLGRRTLLLYLISIISGAIMFALSIDYLLPREWFTSHLEAMRTCCHESPSYFQIGCSLLLLILLANALIHRHIPQGNDKDKNCLHTDRCACQQTGTDNRPRVIYVHGMSCNHCRSNVEKVVSSIPEVESVSVDLPTGKTLIIGNPDMETVCRAIESIGFQVTTGETQ